MSAGTSSALEGLTVIDLGQVYFGPYASMLLARMGANVIKVEPLTGEPYRRPTPIKGTEAVQFSLVNSGKRGIAIDLKNERGHQLLLDLVAEADVLVQNFAPGVMERLGLSFEVLQAANPRLVVGWGSGYGTFGPYSQDRAMDLTIQARTAVMATTGLEDGEPLRTGPAVVDFLAGAHLAMGILGALVQRGITGRGQLVDASMQDAVIPTLASNLGGYFDSDGTVPERTGNRHGGLATVPYNTYATADGWLAILAPREDHWVRLCELMGRPELGNDEEWGTNAGRVAHADEVDALIAAWTAERPTDELYELVNAAAIPCAPVVSLKDLLTDPHVAARGILREFPGPDGESWWAIGHPVRLSDSFEAPIARAPGLGQHTDEILTEQLALTTEEIRDLRTAGVVK